MNSQARGVSHKHKPKLVFSNLVLLKKEAKVHSQETVKIYQLIASKAKSTSPHRFFLHHH
jgi:hypothetical protein